MKISRVELTSELLVLTSDSGFSGTGEIPGGRERSSLVVADLLVGRDPFDVEALLRDSGVDGAIDDVSLVAAATSAMLDVASQSLGTSISQLLAGMMNDTARACAVDWEQGATDTAQLADAARATVAEGYTMLRVESALGKIGPDVVRSVRAAVGDEIDLVVLGPPSSSVADAAAFASAIASSQPLWIEDVVPSWPREPLERIAGRINTPLAAGRGVRPELLRDLARTTLIDHLIVEVDRVGGLLEARRLAALAEIQHTGVVVTSVSLRDALQLAAVLPNLTAVEVPRGHAAIEHGMVETTRSIP